MVQWAGGAYHADHLVTVFSVSITEGVQMFLRCRKALVLASACLTVATTAHAAVIDFESLAIDDAAYHNVPNWKYVEEGFQIAGDYLYVTGTQHEYFAGSTGLHTHAGAS